jgi:trk system potassium uptake protein TrkH
MLTSAGVSLAYGEDIARALLMASVVTLGAGALIYRTTAFKGDVTTREGFAIVTLAWTATAVAGALPYLFTGVLESPAAAVFESMSGFTTTGASVFHDVEALPHGVLYWRSLTHWLGGMGIIVLAIAVLPYLGVGGMQLFRAEVPGPTPERLRPRITQTAKLLWLVYVGLTLAQTALYAAGGMGWFDALNHAFSTLATGGFSTQNASMAAYPSPFIHWVTIVFMYLAGVNFALHFRAATGRPVYWHDQEWRFFTLLLLAAAGTIAVLNLAAGSTPGLEPAIRDAFFQAASIITTTGFASADYELWVPGAQMTLFALFFVGGMAGSTGGGIKAVRVLLLLKHTFNEIRKNLHPRAILLTRIGTKPVREDVLAHVIGFVVLYMLLCLAGSVVMGLMGMEPLTAISASIATVGNVGPGFGNIGPTDNYGWMTNPELSVLSFLMLVGRLEIFTVLVLFHRETWKARRSYH